MTAPRRCTYEGCETDYRLAPDHPGRATLCPRHARLHEDVPRQQGYMTPTGSKGTGLEINFLPIGVTPPRRHGVKNN